jgi:hypothetical protein
VSNANRVWRAQPTAKRGPRYFTADTRMLTDAQNTWFFETFGYEPPDLLYAPYLDRFVYAVRGPHGSHRGVIARSFSGAVPKSLTYKYLDEPFLGWCSGSGGDGPLVVVEDWVSAEKVATAGFDTVALNGTLLNEERLEEIASVTASSVVLAYDPDAYGVALIYQRRNPSDNLMVARLKVDLKYEPLERIKKVFDSGNYDFWGS